MMRYLIIFYFLVLICACQNFGSTDNVGFHLPTYDMPYVLNAPTYSFYPDNKLKEISGIDFDTATGRLYAVEDENGILYEIDTTGAIINTYDIGNDGDYEGVEIHNRKAYIAESNGTVTVFDLINNVKVAKLKNNLSSKNNIEGIASTPTGDLLLVCKDKSLREDEIKGVHHIYKASSTEDEDVVKYFGIDIEEIKELESIKLKTNNITKLLVNSRISNYSPSGMDRHPNGNLYIVSSRTGMVTILQNDSIMLGTYFTRKSTNVQAEGLAFDTRGNLYLANEARGRKAVIHVYEPTN